MSVPGAARLRLAVERLTEARKFIREAIPAGVDWPYEGRTWALYDAVAALQLQLIELIDDIHRESEAD